MKKVWPDILYLLLIGLVLGIVTLLAPTKDVSLGARILFGCLALLFIVLSIFSARFSGWGNAAIESSLKKNEIFETIWFVKETDNKYIVKIKARNGREIIVRMGSLPPKVFKVVSEHNYTCYPPA